MRVGVVGAGGLGGFLGAILIRAGVETVFLVRTGSVRALRDEGLTVRSDIAGSFTVKVDATDSPDRVGPVDYVLFCVKTYDIEPAAGAALPLVGRETAVIPVQNGIDSWERIGAVLGQRSLIAGIAYVAAARQGPTLIVQRGPMRKFQLGSLSGRQEGRVMAAAALLERAGLQAEIVADPQTARWTTFVMVCATGGVMALTRQPVGPVLADPEARHLFMATMNEVREVALRLGVKLDPGLPARLLEYVGVHMAPTSRSSQLDDLLAGRRLELDSLNGKVVELGRRLGIETPVNQAIYAALRPYAGGSPGPSASDTA